MKKKKYWIVLCVVLLPLIGLLINSVVEQTKLDIKGVYIIGTLYKMDKAGFHGGMRCYKYRFRNKKYQKCITATNFVDSLAFIHILPNNPKIGKIIYESHVPSCLTLKDIPESGWKELPLNTCQ